MPLAWCATGGHDPASMAGQCSYCGSLSVQCNACQVPTVLEGKQRCPGCGSVYEEYAATRVSSMRFGGSHDLQVRPRLPSEASDLVK